jgi:hypothetical protein
MVDTVRHPHMGFEPQQPRSKLELVNGFAEHMAQGLEEVKVALTKVKDEYTIYYNWHWEPAPVFTQGDRVWLDGSNIATNRPSSKLSHQCLGLFVVGKCIGHGAYHLILPPHFHCLHPVFPIVKLSLAHTDPIPGRQPALPPLPTVIDSEKEYDVETILDSQMHYNRLEYLVKWKGYNKSHNQWEEYMCKLHAKSKIV